MTPTTNSIFSGSDRFRPRESPSSGGSLGLSLRDIVPTLVGPKEYRSNEIEPVSSLPERIFSALSEAKIWTSRVSMHMDLATRDRYFRQLDLLHDCDEWFGDDKPVLLESYKDFIRFMLLVGRGSKPSLGLSSEGRLLAIWEQKGDRLTIEFTADGFAKWVVRRHVGEQIERAAGTTLVGRLKAVLAPYEPEAWFTVG